MKRNNDQFWADVYAIGKREIERKAVAWLRARAADEAMQRELAEKFGGKDGDCPGCEKCEDWVRGQRGEGATLKE